MCPITREKDLEKQQELFDKINQEMIQPHAEVIEQLLINNGSGYLVGNAVRNLIFKSFFLN
jgi:glutathione S-transferase